MTHRSLRPAIALAAGLMAVQEAGAQACELSAMYRDLPKLATGNATVGEAWRQCIKSQDPEGIAHAALSRARDAIEGKDLPIQRELEAGRLKELLGELKDKWPDSDGLGAFCYEAELRTYASVLWRRTATLRELKFEPLSELDRAMTSQRGSVREELARLAVLADRENPIRCLSDLDEAARLAKGAEDLLARKPTATCAQLLGEIRRLPPAGDRTAHQARTQEVVPNCPATSEPRLEKVVKGWCQDADSTTWAKLVKQFGVEGGLVLRDIKSLSPVPGERPSPLRESLDGLEYFASPKPMPQADEASRRVQAGLEGLRALRRARTGLQRVRAFADGMELLLKGHPTAVHGRLEQEQDWTSDPRLRALDAVARYWAAGDRPAPARDWNSLERELFEILGSPVP